MNQTIFDPLISKRDKNLSKYEFAKFNGKRYDLTQLSKKLLVEPPMHIAQHIFKDEVINFVLDKAFLELPLKSECLQAMSQCFLKAENR